MPTKTKIREYILITKLSAMTAYYVCFLFFLLLCHKISLESGLPAETITLSKFQYRYLIFAPYLHYPVNLTLEYQRGSHSMKNFGNYTHLKFEFIKLNSLKCWKKNHCKKFLILIQKELGGMKRYILLEIDT